MGNGLHVHMLVQQLGYAYPKVLCATNVLPVTFCRLLYSVASISFRNTETAANHLQEDLAMDKLALLPLIPLSKKQDGMIGEATARMRRWLFVLTSMP